MVQNDNSGKSYNRIYKNITVRIPTENFQKFIDGISEGVEYFDRKDISRQDVSEEFVDLEARQKAKRVLEDRYLELLKKANKVEEMLQIERELSNIREEIEAKQGRLQYLQNQVSMSTVHIEFYKTTAETGITQSYGQKMKNALQGGWNGISVFFLGVLYLWPLFLVAIMIVIVLLAFGVHFLIRNRLAKRVAERLSKEETFGNLSTAFMKSTKVWRSIFQGSPAGWNRRTRARVDAIRHATDRFVQHLNDRFTSPSGDKGKSGKQA